MLGLVIFVLLHPGYDRTDGLNKLAKMSKAKT